MVRTIIERLRYRYVMWRSAKALANLRARREADRFAEPWLLALEEIRKEVEAQTGEEGRDVV